MRDYLTKTFSHVARIDDFYIAAGNRAPLITDLPSDTGKEIFEMAVRIFESLLDQNEDGTVVAEEYGEDCDFGDVLDGDGCSSQCLHEGTPACAFGCSISGTACITNAQCDLGQTCDPINAPCCGDLVITDSHEDCDGELGCSDSCTWLGSSVHYQVPSYCGDGVKEAYEECEVSGDAVLEIRNYGVSEVAPGAVLELDSEDKAYSDIKAEIDIDPSKSAISALSLSCTCQTDAQCGDVDTLGCSASGCCTPRPHLETDGSGPMLPISNAENNGALTGGMDAYCRNTAMSVYFDAPIDAETIDPSTDDNEDGQISIDEYDSHITLVLYRAGGVLVTSNPALLCPDTHLRVAMGESQNFFAKIWGWTKQLLFGWLPNSVQAKVLDDTHCHVPIKFEVSNSNDGAEVQIIPQVPLEADGEYRIYVDGDDTPNDQTHDGILSPEGAPVCVMPDGEDGCDPNWNENFLTSDGFCKLDLVQVEDVNKVSPAQLPFESYSDGLFTSHGEIHQFTSKSFTLRDSGNLEQIIEVPGSYEWQWDWNSNVTDPSLDVVDLVADPGDATQALYTTAGNEGDEFIVATTTISTDELFDPTTVAKEISGTHLATAFICENPWPTLGGDFPFVEDTEDTNFSMYYCRDFGDAGTQDDLPGLTDRKSVV